MTAITLAAHPAAFPAVGHPQPAHVLGSLDGEGRLEQAAAQIRRVPAGVAAGHPVTAEVGLRVLASGGSAADAAIAAVLTSCVAESVLTGMGGGGFATYFDATTKSVTCLDFFCAVPGLDGDAPAGPMIPIEVSFGGLPMRYAIGAASVGVPGIPAGCGEVHRRWGRLPWHRVVTPAISLARSGVVLPAAQARTLASVAPALVPGVGAAIYSPGGKLLQGGDLLYHPGLDTALAALADEGPEAFYTGWIGRRLVEAVRAGGGSIGPIDLAAYRVLALPVERASLGGTHIYARRDLNRVIPTIGSLPASLPDMAPGERAVALADALVAYGRQRLGDTTNVSVIDADGNACVITTTLGIGSGVWLPGLGVHLNSMLGEGELITPDLVAGDRMASNMCPLVGVNDAGELVVAAGSAGASRIRTALAHTLVNVLIRNTTMTEAISAPRFHVVGGPGVGDVGGPGVQDVGGPGVGDVTAVSADSSPATERSAATEMIEARTNAMVYAELDYPEEELTALEAAGYPVTRWDHLSHYFGGASAVGHAGAAGDPRRGGVGLLL